MFNTKKLKYLITKSREIKRTLFQEENRLLINGTILNFSKMNTYSSRYRKLDLKYNCKLLIIYNYNYFHIDLVSGPITIGIENYHNNSTNILMPNYTFLTNENLELPFDDLPKNLYDWSEEELFYYELKYKN